MITIRALLDRIRWDPGFGRGHFAIGYYDRVDDRLILVDLQDVRADPGDRFALEISSADGAVHSVPLHRIYEVYRDGERIWQRRRRAP